MDTLLNTCIRICRFLERKLLKAVGSNDKGKENKVTIKASGNAYVLEYTKGHSIKDHLKRFRLYDRFLPYLALHSNKGVIDIGANVGDTLVLIKSKIDSKVICVEPDLDFYEKISTNIRINEFKNVLRYNYAISSLNKNISVQKNNAKTTAHIVDSEESNSVQTKRFSEIFIDLNVDASEYNIIKIDTDGFDWDILDSIHQHLTETNDGFDFIFYEHQITLNNLGIHDPDMHARSGQFMDSLKKLRNIGYTHYFIFDNFGAFILQTQDLSCIESLSDYGLRAKSNRRTFDFVDVLVCKGEKIETVHRAIDEYQKNDITIEG
jgi:FkbM family methyltransferase